jgi:hypothetical protein
MYSVVGVAARPNSPDESASVVTAALAMCTARTPAPSAT